MAISPSGIDTRKSGGALVIRSQFFNSAGALLNSGAATVCIGELQSDGSFKTFDFSDNAFKASNVAPTTPAAPLNHQKLANATVDTGVFTAALANTGNFTVGGIYFALSYHPNAVPSYQGREFQWGGTEGDMVVQTGDCFPRVNVAGGLATADAQSALANAVAAISNNTSSRLVTPTLLEVPETGSTSFKLYLQIMDENGNMEAPDALPTMAVANAQGTSRSAKLGPVTLISTGYYSATYTVASTDPAEQLIFTATVVEGDATRIIPAISNVVNADITATAMLVAQMAADYQKRNEAVTLPVGTATSADIAAAQGAIVDALPDDYQQRGQAVMLPEGAAQTSDLEVVNEALTDLLTGLTSIGLDLEFLCIRNSNWAKNEDGQIVYTRGEKTLTYDVTRDTQGVPDSATLVV